MIHSVHTCHNCKYNGIGDSRCITCNRVAQDDIRIKRTPHVTNEMMVNNPPTDPHPSGVTDLPVEVENKLRIAIANLFDLSPIQLLLVQHLIRGYRMSSFGDRLIQISSHISKCRGSKRAMAGMMRNSIVEKFPALAVILGGEAKTKEVINEAVGYDDVDLFDFAGVKV